MPTLRRFRHLGALMLVLSVLSSAGGHLFGLQTIAWATMFAKNIRHDSALGAARKTFDGKHPCGRCHEIAAGEAKRASIPAQELERRFDSFFLPNPPLPAQSSRARDVEWIVSDSPLSTRESVPPTPPPRASSFSA